MTQDFGENGLKLSNKDLDLDSISSEESGGLNNDLEHHVRDSRVFEEIWDAETIWNDLRILPGAQKLVELINAGNVLLVDSNSKSTGLLLASWFGNEKVVKFLIEFGADVGVEDGGGRTALHLASIIGHEGIVKALLQHGANVHKSNTTRKIAPLHCAASRGHLPCIRLLLKYGANVNVSVGNKSPLYYATQCNSADCVRELLNAGANPNTTEIFSETPLHVAAALGSVEIVKLLLKHKAEVRVQCGDEKITALHLAAEDGNAECAQLLVDGGASISATNKKQQTPLHSAALSQSSETLELLLKRGANPNVQDIDGRTPLHGAIVKVSRSSDCAKLLIKYGADVNKADAFGYTPLHLAALNEFPQCVLLLLNHGGDVTVRTNGGISVLTFITRRTPEVIPKMVEKFDASIKVNDHEIGDVDCELKLDFRILVPSTCKGETELLLNFIEVGHRELLKHPLSETFLFLKWRRIRKFFFVSLMSHFLFAALFTYYTLGVFLRDCPSKRVNSGKPVNCMVGLHLTIVGYLLIIFNIMMVVKELFQIANSWRSYVKEWENWLQWSIIISVFCCVAMESRNIQYSLYNWQHHVAAIGIFFTWLELMMIVGRFPIFGLYVQMFTTVSVNFAKFLMAYSCLLVAFGLSFSVLLPNFPAFFNIALSMLKIIMMMIGELEYEDIFHDDDRKIQYPYTTHIMFLTFVILVTIILMNLMVGLAVSDIQGLQTSAGLDRIVRQAELVAHLESMLFSPLLTWLPKKLLHFLHRKALLLKSEYHWALYLKPNDPRESRIPKDLISNIYELVAKSKPGRKRRSERYRYKYFQANNNYQSPMFAGNNIQCSNATKAVSDISSCTDNAPCLSRMNSNVTNTSTDNIDLESAFRMRLNTLNSGVKNTEYKNILLK